MDYEKGASSVDPDQRPRGLYEKVKWTSLTKVLEETSPKQREI